MSHSKKEGKFVKIEGRTIFIGGPGSGSGGASAGSYLMQQPAAFYGGKDASGNPLPQGTQPSDLKPGQSLKREGYSDGMIGTSAADLRNPQSSASVAQEAGWKVVNTGDLGITTAVHRASPYIGARLRTVSDMIAVDLFDLSDGKPINSSHRTVWMMNSTALPDRKTLIETVNAWISK